MKDGRISAELLLRYIEGHWNPYARNHTSGARTFTFLPTNGSRYEFDLSALLFGLVYNRGLFVQSLDEILDGDDRYLKVHQTVADQAVFVSSDQSSGILPNRPMAFGGLNAELQDMCEQVGLYKRNVFYSFRRTALTETRRRDGLESARELAGHVPDTNSIFQYDARGLADMDITAFRLQEQRH
ncbi:hypothetical protein EJ04DRAFT_564779 [Polyplosphaeria fusca]|uniref:Uncharacterized protein n=1 Tax=Polyplosphaeria fusca TaxID=682080 RepID=A0A9P4QTV1_9PLEO|nr:hypothetical protein EJ04DRAFT_564779 [Polyplosphaeria fusca]